MLKRKSKIILVLLVLFTLVVSTFSLADNSQTATNAENATNTATTQNQTEQTNDANINQTVAQNAQSSDAYILGETVNIDYLIDGNAFIMANNVTISSNAQIGGDAFIMADTVTFEENTFVYSNAFILANNIVINGTICDLYTVSGNVTIGQTGVVYRDMRLSSDALTIAGSVGRNAYVDCNNISFAQANTQEQNTITSNGMVYGNLHYTAENEQNIPEGSVSGEVKYTAKTLNSNTVQQYVSSAIMAITLAIVIWIILMWLAPKFKETTQELLAKKPAPSLGLGIVSLIVIPIIIFMLILLQITASAALLILTIYILLLIIGANIFAITLSGLIASKFKSKNKVIEFIFVIVITAIIWAFRFIPYVGGVLGFICTVFGLGLLTKAVLPKKENATESNSKKEEKTQESEESK